MLEGDRKDGWGLKKIFYLSIAGVAFALGTIGVFVPFIPTTGFYVLTSFCLLRSSEKRYNQFVQSKYYQSYVVDLFIRKNISTRGLIRMFLLMGVVFALPIVIVSSIFLKGFLFAIYLAHVVGLTWYLKFHPRKKRVSKQVISEER